MVPVFGDDRIVLQTVRHCQQVFSAAFIGHVEASYDDQATKNELCTVVPHPDSADRLHEHAARLDDERSALGRRSRARRVAPARPARLVVRPDADPADAEAAAAAALEFGPAALEKLGAYLAT